jgi:rare lipoprotein A
VTATGRRLRGALIPVLVCALAGGALSGCALFRRAPPPAPPHAVLERAYQANGVWFYPRESYALDQTGIASILPAGHARLTTDGERYDPEALSAAHQTLQLPAVARLTNLGNGRQVTVRINDRGPPDPARVVAVSPRAASLLGFPPEGVARVRVQVLEAESHAAIDAAGGSPTPALAIAAAPRGEVAAADLPPPPGIGQSRGAAVVRGAGGPSSAGPAPAVTVPLRLPETVTQVPPAPGLLYVRLDAFSRYDYAARERALVPGLPGTIERARTGRSESFRVRLGPFASIPEADAALAQVLRAGVPDARIVVEQEALP